MAETTASKHRIKALFQYSTTWSTVWYWREWTVFAAWVLGIIAAASVVIAVPALIRHGDAVACRNKARAMHREYRSGFLEGCLVRLDDGSFIPLGNLRTTDLERR